MRFFPAFIRDWLVDYRTRHRAKLIRPDPMKKVATPPQKFEACLNLFFRKLRRLDPDIRVLTLPIMAYVEHMEIRSQGYGKNLDRYNGILEKYSRTNQAQWVEPERIIGGKDIAALFCDDGYHFNEHGNELIAHALYAQLAGDGSQQTGSS